MEQMIKINVPDGFHAVWDEKKRKIEFVRKESWRDIKTFNDVLNYLGIKENDLRSLYLPNLNKCVSFVKWRLIMEAFIKASNDNSQLTKGIIFYPCYYIVYNDEYIFNDEETKVRSGIINNRECTLVGKAYTGSHAGIGGALSTFSVINANAAHISFRAFSSYEVAEHVSKYFTWELYESTLGWRTNEIKWL